MHYVQCRVGTRNTGVMPTCRAMPSRWNAGDDVSGCWRPGLPRGYRLRTADSKYLEHAANIHISAAAV